MRSYLTISRQKMNETDVKSIYVSTCWLIFSPVCAILQPHTSFHNDKIILTGVVISAVLEKLCLRLKWFFVVSANKSLSPHCRVPFSSFFIFRWVHLTENQRFNLLSVRGGWGERLGARIAVANRSTASDQLHSFSHMRQNWSADIFQRLFGSLQRHLRT